jgi:hypothetical protein
LRTRRVVELEEDVEVESHIIVVDVVMEESRRL